MNLIPKTNTELSPTRGRPTRSPIENYQSHVAKRYQELQKLRKQFAIELKRRYPKLSSASLADIEQLILATAEEYRLWSAVDNQLLAIQRHKEPIKQFAVQRDKINALLVQLRQTYQLILSQRDQEVLPYETHWCDASSEFIIQKLSRIEMQAANAQTATLCGVTMWFETQCLQPMNLATVQRHRSILRTALNYMVSNRIGVLFPLIKANSPGRPKLPLPVELVRAEQALIDDYQSLSNACHERQLTPEPPVKIWRKYYATTKKKVGRKPLNKKQKIRRDLLKLEQQLRELEQNQPAMKDVGREPRTQRGRKPLTYEQKKQKLQEKIQTLTNMIT